MIVCTKSKYR